MTSPGRSDVHRDRLATILQQNRKKILENWFSILRQKWTGQAESKLSILEQKIAVQEDLFSLLIGDARHSLINLDCASSQKYSVLDLFDEAVSLENAILSLFHGTHIPRDERKLLNSIVHEQILARVRDLLRDTLDLLYCLTEGGQRGYCQTDKEGKVVCANREMHRLLGREFAPGEGLKELFIKSDWTFLDEVFSGKHGDSPGLRRLYLNSPDNKAIPVGAEVCPMDIGGQRQGWYVCLVDLSRQHQTELGVFENLPVGLARVDLDGNFHYANRKFLESLELEDQGWCGKSLKDFLRGEDLKKVEEQIERRRHGQCGEYEVSFTRKSGHKVPVKIYAVPETDLAGKEIGSIAVIRSMELDKAIAKMHELMASEEKWEDMLRKVIQEVKPFIPYDLGTVLEISPNQKHIRRLLTEPFIAESQKMVRWAVPNKVQEWLAEQKKILIIDDMETFLSQPNFLETEKDKMVQEFLRQGYCSCIRLPIIKKEHLASVPLASISLYSKEKGYYNETHEEVLKALPLDKAVRLALYQQKEEESRFFGKVIKKISAEGRDFREVADTLVNDLRDHYGWGNVAFFRADEDLNLLHLVEQENSPDTLPIPEGYTQPLNKGVLGWVYENKEDVNIGNVKEDPRFKGIYISPWRRKGSISVDNAGSELCLRVATEHACFILNIEDRSLNAFSDKDFNALKDFRDQAKAVLERSWINHALSAALDSTSDAIIFTDRKGRITKANPTAVSLLRYREEEMEGLFLKDYFQDAKLAEEAIKKRYFPTQEVVWLNKDKESVRLLLSASPLPEEEFGGKIFTGKNLAEKDWVERLEDLEKLYQEIAIQMKTPLSLAFAWLKGLIRKDPQSKEAMDLEKVIKQLRKVDLTFDRLSLYDYDEEKSWFPVHELELGLEEVLLNVRDDLPEGDWQRIVKPSRPLPTLRGDLFQLTFCVETILAHLLQVIPEDDKVEIRVESDGERIVMEFSGVCPEIQDSQLNRALAAIATGENLIDRFMKNHDGEYQKRKDGNRMFFCLNLPAAKGD